MITLKISLYFVHDTGFVINGWFHTMSPINKKLLPLRCLLISSSYNSLRISLRIICWRLEERLLETRFKSLPAYDLTYFKLTPSPACYLDSHIYHLHITQSTMDIANSNLWGFLENVSKLQMHKKQFTPVRGISINLQIFSLISCWRMIARDCWRKTYNFWYVSFIY